jgi:hypothetical protein
MKIPDECNTKQFQDTMRKWALRKLRFGYRFQPKFSREIQFRQFDQSLYDDDLEALAQDIVQESWLAIRKKPEPSPPIRSWHTFFALQLVYRIQTRQRKNERNPPPIALMAPLEDPFGESKEICPIDSIPSSQSDLEETRWNRWADQMNSVYLQMLSAVEKALEERVTAKKIRNKAAIPYFLETVKQLLLDPDADFDTCRLSVGRGISKATAGNWWLQIRDGLPFSIEQYKRLSRGEIE